MYRAAICTKAIGASFLLLATLIAVKSRALAEEVAEQPAAKLTSAIVSSEDAEFFELKIRPLLVGKCQSCHGPDKQENGLRVDSRGALLAGGTSGPLVLLDEAGLPTQNGSHRLLEVTSGSGDLVMPPDEPLSEEERTALATWVSKGLPWPNDESAPQAAPATPQEKLAIAQATLWSMQPVRDLSLPKVQQPSRGANPIDLWILHRQEQAGIPHSAPRAPAASLLRRLSLDLLGIPPTFEQTRQFANETRPDAYHRAVDRMLASPRHGERWGRHWLDVARYADTRGYEFEGRDRRFPYSYTYRDYVIDSHNADLPYHQFLLEQLAADQLPTPRSKEALAALGFLTLGRHYIQPDDTLDDRIDVVTRGLMGVTVICARCHDHKFDPIPTQDYYSLYGVFASSDEPSDLPLIADPEPNDPNYQSFLAEHAERTKEYQDFRTVKHQELQALLLKQIPQYLLEAVAEETTQTGVALASCLSFDREELRPGYVNTWKRFLEGRESDDPVWGLWKTGVLTAKAEAGKLPAGSGFEQIVVTGFYAPEKPCDPALLAAIRSKAPQKLEELASVYAEYIQNQKQAWDADQGARQLAVDAKHRLALVLYARSSPLNLETDHLDRHLARDVKNQLENKRRKIDTCETQHAGAPARAMVLKDRDTPYEPVVFVRGNPQRHGERVPRRVPAMVGGWERQPFQTGSGRLELAQAIVAPSNPFTARVQVNRVWQHHFGRGLLPAGNDLGMRSVPPTHPELLDHLAHQFVQSGWSMKRLHRAIVLSETYQQDSKTYASQALAQDPDNLLLARQNRRRLELEPLRDALLHASGRLDLTYRGRPAELWRGTPSLRRAVYGFIDRQDLPNAFRVFDLPSPDVSTGERAETTVPQQALLLMNSPLALESANALAGRVLQIPFDDERLEALFRLVLARSPNESERQMCQEFLVQDAARNPAGSVQGRWQLLAHSLLLTNEFAFVD